jgi:hypothetical protein
LGGATAAPPAPHSEERLAVPLAAQSGARPIETAPAAADATRPAEEISAPAPTTPFESPPPLDRKAPEEVDKPIAPAATAPPKIERAAVPPVDSTLHEAPLPPAAPVTSAAPPPIEREVAPAVEPPPREAPTPPAPQPVAPVAPSRVEPQVASPADTATPRIAPAETSAPPERIAPKIEREAATPATPSPRSQPVETAPRIDPVAPPAAAPGRTLSAPAPPRTDGPSGATPPRLRFGAPDPGEEIFKPRDDAARPTAEPGSAPRLDLDATRQRAREVASEGAGYRGIVPALPPPPDRKSKLADAIDKAQKPDCRDAYAAMGLLAVPALVASAVANGGCRW